MTWYQLEQRAPTISFVIGAIVAWIVIRINYHPTVPIKDLLGTAITVSAITVGFFATIKALLFSIDDKPGIIILKQLNRYQVFIRYLITATNSSFALTFVSGIGLLIDCSSPLSICGKIFITFWSALCLSTLVACFRAIQIFSVLLTVDNIESLKKADKPPVTQ